MLRTFKYRLFTNRSQERELGICLETHRRLYNRCLEAKSFIWEQYRVDWSCNEQSRWLTRERKQNTFLSRLSAHSSQQTLRRLNRAFQGFYRRCKQGSKPGYPRFQGPDRFNSFSYVMTGNGGGAKIVNGKLRLQNIGAIRVRWHRDIPAEAKFKTASIIRENGKWFVAFAVELPDPGPTANSRSTGIDLGLSHFVVDAEGEIYGNTRLLECRLAELRRRQRKLSRCKKGSNRRKQVKKSVTSLHAKIRNARKDMHHKVSRNLADRFGTIAVENLNVQGMIKNRRLARRISDAGWSQFVGFLVYKAESAGGKVIKVDPKYTSQQCSNCGAIVRKSLAVRVHRCDCGSVLDRDENAARNVLGRAAPEIANAEVVLH